MTNLKKLFEQATARPWKVCPDERMIESEHPVNFKGHYEHVCDFRHDLNGDVDLANAQLITTAANHFQAVVEALERTADVIGHNSCTDGNTPNGFVVALDKARSVLAAIEKDAGQ